MTVEDTIKKYIAEVNMCNSDTIDNTDGLEEILGFDSLDIVEFIMALEEEFGIFISDEDAEEFTTVQDVIDYVKKKKEA